LYPAAEKKFLHSAGGKEITDVGKSIRYSIKSTFKKIDQLSQENHTSKAGSKLKTGLEVAQAIAGDKDVLNALQSAERNDGTELRAEDRFWLLIMRPRRLK
tara:strand:- start:483 stop:785 length:303 start_codon:yes stop_codon:yes gene_type:complete